MRRSRQKLFLEGRAGALARPGDRLAGKSDCPPGAKVVARRHAFVFLMKRWMPILLLVLVPFSSRAESEAPTAQRTVLLPPLIVSGSPNDPVWHYVELPGFEILSNCSVRVTKGFAESWERLYASVRVILPEELVPRASVPRTMILVSETLTRGVTKEIAVEMTRAETAREMSERAAVALQKQPSGAAALTGPARATPVYEFLPNLLIPDRDSETTFTIVRETEFDQEQLTLADDSVRALLERRAPPLPRWFIEGILSLYATGSLRERGFSLPRFQWTPKSELDELRLLVEANKAGTEAAAARAVSAELRKNESGKAGPPPGVLLPCADLFLPKLPADPVERTDYQRKRAQQTALFIRWCYEPKEPARKQALGKLVELACTEPVTERLFVDCFGLSFGDLKTRLTEYLVQASSYNGALRLSPDKARRPSAKVRPATPTEVARVMGNWQRLASGYLKTSQPTLVEKYAAQAYRTLQREYQSGERDPRLLAVLGLLECDTGHDEDARPLLEAVVDAKISRPRAYYELARIKSSAAKEKLDAAQVADVLALLFAAREQAPPLLEVYRLLATVWDRSAVAPTRANLTVLEEGVRFFPGDVELVYRSAALFAKHGYAAEAAVLAKHGLRLTADEPLRRRFEALSAPPGSPDGEK
jgi:hypothetical protein